MSKMLCPHCGELVEAEDGPCLFCRRSSTLAERQAAGRARDAEPPTKEEFIGVHGINPRARGAILVVLAGIGVGLGGQAVKQKAWGFPVEKEIRETRKRIDVDQASLSRQLTIESLGWDDARPGKPKHSVELRRNLAEQRRDLAGYERLRRSRTPLYVGLSFLAFVGAAVSWWRPFHGTLVAAAGSLVVFVGFMVYCWFLVVTDPRSLLGALGVEALLLYPSWRLQRYQWYLRDPPSGSSGAPSPVSG